MSYPGAWQDGLTHVQTLSPGVSAWEPTPYAHPYHLPGRVGGIESGVGNAAQWLLEGGNCAWMHCRRGSAPGPIQIDPTCPALDPGRTYGQYTRSGIEISSQYIPPAPGISEMTRWTLSYAAAGSISVFNKYTTELNASRNNWIAPPSAEWPAGVVGVEFDRTDWELDLERIEVDGYGFTETSNPVAPVRPEMYARVVHPDVSAPSAWWSGAPHHVNDPATIADWTGAGKGQGPYAPGEAWEVDPSLFPYITQDGSEIDSHHLSLAVIPDAMRNAASPWSPEITGTAGGTLTTPTVRMHFRSARWRYLYDQPQPLPASPRLPPLRQMASDARAASSAARIFPTSAEQSSVRRLGYY